MEIKEVKNKINDFVPPSEFNKFFFEWKKEQYRQGYNWSVKSEEIFRNCMLTGLVYMDNVNKEKSEDNSVVEKVEVQAEEKRTRTRSKPETSDTVEPISAVATLGDAL